MHQRLTTPLEKPGAMTFFQALPQEHLSLVKHLTAETKTEQFISGRGLVIKWERLRRQNQNVGVGELHTSALVEHARENRVDVLEMIKIVEHGVDFGGG